MRPEYITYWDNVIREWAADGSVPSSEKCWFVPESRLRTELMPEPYWGDPYNCSAVLLNYNPGGPDGQPSPDDKCHINHVHSGDTSKMSGALHDCYSHQAIRFPWLDADDELVEFVATAEDTKKWMRQRNRWISRIASSDRRPFFFDLCGWHSKNWSLGNYTPEIRAYIAEHILPMLHEAIAKSDLGIGLCVGKQLGDRVLPGLGFTEVTSQMGFDVKDSSKGWQPIPEVNRWYRIYRSADGTYIVNTWTLGSNRQPGARFNKYENQIINKIKTTE